VDRRANPSSVLPVKYTPQKVPIQNLTFGSVTRLGEFSLIGRLFTLGSFLKITEGSPYFSAVGVYAFMYLGDVVGW
jgi:hypothetical protein